MTPQEVAKKVTPSVVCIQNYQITQQYGGVFFGYGYSDSEDSALSPAGKALALFFPKTAIF